MDRPDPPPRPDQRTSPFVDLIPRRDRIIAFIVEVTVYMVGFGILAYVIATCGNC